jgi:thymidylate kinase
VIVVVDGNDGTGKSTVVARLRALGIDARDRGVPTKMTDDPSVAPVDGETYLILDVPVEVSRERLARAGKDLDERYHTVADLEHYRARYREIANALPRCALIDGTGTPEEVVARCLESLRRA